MKGKMLLGSAILSIAFNRAAYLDAVGCQREVVAVGLEKPTLLVDDMSHIRLVEAECHGTIYLRQVTDQIRGHGKDGSILQHPGLTLTEL